MNEVIFMKNLKTGISAVMSVLFFTAFAEVKDIEFSRKGDKLVIGGFDYSTAEGRKSCPGGSFMIPLTAAKKASKSFRLKYSERKTWVFMPCPLPARDIQSLELYAENAKLKVGTDYYLSPEGGLAGLKDIKPFKVKAHYTFLTGRYDSIFLDKKKGNLLHLKGRQRDIDSEEYIPECPSGCIRLFNISVKGDNYKVIPVIPPEIPKPVGLEKFVAKVKTGGKVKIAGYGDSITAVQIRKYPGFNANGKFRDRPERYLYRYPEDTVSRYELYDFGDGLGKRHCKIGWNWPSVTMLKNKYGLDVEYLNFGIGGTNSAETKNNGLYPPRLKKAIEAKPDLVVLAFGMNEIGNPQTGKRVSGIIKAFKAGGAEIIVFGVPQINGTRRGTIKNWDKTNSLLASAAAESDCVFVDPRTIGLGIAPEHICSANLYNHPGPGELKVYGRFLRDIISMALK
jgi:lysophospholipase L1-like esterase